MVTLKTKGGIWKWMWTCMSMPRCWFLKFIEKNTQGNVKFVKLVVNNECRWIVHQLECGAPAGQAALFHNPELTLELLITQLKFPDCVTEHKIILIQPGPSAPGCCCPPRLELRRVLGHVLPAVGGPGQNMATAIWGKIWSSASLFALCSWDGVCCCISIMEVSSPVITPWHEQWIWYPVTPWGSFMKNQCSIAEPLLPSPDKHSCSEFQIKRINHRAVPGVG